MRMTSDEEKSIDKIKELFNALSDDGKDVVISEFIESEDFMRRVLSVLLESEEKIDPSTHTGGFIEFLRKVRE